MVDEKSLETPEDLFIQGKKLYLAGEYSNALVLLAKACKEMELKFGDLNEAMFEPYYVLSKSYYYYSKQEGFLLADGLEIKEDENENVEEDKVNEDKIDEVKVGEVKVDEDKVDEDKVDEDKVDEDKVDEDKIDEDKIDEDKISEDKIDKVKVDEGKLEDTDEEKEAEMVVASESTEIKEEAEVSGDETEVKDDEELSYLQLSYETMECAKRILQKQLDYKPMDEKELLLKMADCCDLVGNIYMEEGVMEEAIVEYNKALEIRSRFAGDADRSVAESHYNLAIAYSSDIRISEAIAEYEKCRAIMDECRTACPDKDEEFSEIIGDINLKIIDLREGERDIQMAKEMLTRGFAAVTGGKPDVPITDLTHLVRRKRTDKALGSDVDSAPKLRRLEDDQE